MTSYLKKYGLRLIDNGYKIIPIKEGKKKPALNAWQNIDATQEILEGWLSNGLSGSGAGVLTKHTPAVDIDVRDKEVVNEMVAFVEELLGKSLKRVGLPPKVLLPFRTDKPFKKISSSQYEDFLGHKHQVEILGDGQQFIAFSIHPDTKQPYKWIDGKSIADIPYVDLPLITQEKAQAIVDHFEKIAEREGWDKVSEGQRSRDREFTGDAFENFKKPLDVSLEKIRETLRKLDPDEHHDVWLHVGMGLHHQFEGRLRGRRIWEKWSEKSIHYDLEEIKIRWSSFGTSKEKLETTNPITFATVIHMANSRAKGIVNKTYQPKDFKWLHVSEIMAKLGPTSWTVENYIEDNSIGLFFGDPASYKSFIALDIAKHCATGKPWNGNEVKKGLVLYIAGEGHSGLSKRVNAWAKHHKIDMSQVPFYISEVAADIYDKQSAEKITESINELVKAYGKPVLIVIDTLARNCGAADENNTADMNIFIDHIDRHLRKPYGAAVLTVHHSGHQHKNRARGAMTVKGAIDFEYLIKRLEALMCSLTCTKMKDAEEPKETFFKGEKVPLEINDDKNKDETSLVFEKTKAPVEVEEEKPLKGKQKALYDLLNNLAEDQESVQKVVFKDKAIEQELFKKESGFRKCLFQLKEKRLVEEEDGKVKIIDPFSK